jgi:CRP/FNR family transcriptional regulator, anaerobic regulatory protein
VAPVVGENVGVRIVAADVGRPKGANQAFDNLEGSRMAVTRNRLVEDSRRVPRMKLAASPPLDPREDTRLIEVIRQHGECVRLRPQQRVALPPPEKLVVLREGVLAIDAMPAKGKLQILDFLVAGDVVTAAIVLRSPGVSLRAITSASMVSLDYRAIDLDQSVDDYWEFLFAQCQSLLVRSNIHQMMIGRLETEPRVASFLLTLALTSGRGHAPILNVSLPMSRTDIANYLVINSDTLSRIMMKFSSLGLIERAGRHSIRILDVDELRKRSPLAPLLSAVFEKGLCQRGGGLRPSLERNASIWISVA